MFIIKKRKFIYFKKKNGDWGLGIGDWGLGIGPNPQSPIPIIFKYDKNFKNYLIYYF